MAGTTSTQDWYFTKETNVKMTRKETALEALNKKIPKLEEKINQDKQLLEELKAKREMLEAEALKKFLHDNGMTTEEIIAKLTASSVVHEQKIVMEDRKNVEH